MYIGSRVGCAERVEKFRFLGGPIGGRIHWIDAGYHDVIVFAGDETDLAEGLGQSAENLGTKHGAFVVDERHDDRAVGEIRTQGNAGSARVSEMIAQRELIAEVLAD